MKEDGDGETGLNSVHFLDKTMDKMHIINMSAKATIKLGCCGLVIIESPGSSGWGAENERENA